MLVEEHVQGGLRVLGAADVRASLDGREEEVIAAVREAYVAHYGGQSSLPHSSFLRFPQNERNRIIALPGYVGGPFQVAGVKWIASFPGNIERGLPRASASIVLNDLVTGFPTAILEGGAISAQRTAASAALAAKLLHSEPNPEAVALVGAGRINGEVLRFLRVSFPSLRRVAVVDMHRERAEQFARGHADDGLSFEVLDRAEQALAGTKLVSLATTSPEPYVEDDGRWGAGSTILHVSLRDLRVSTIKRSVNYADDVDHACRERTSLHLTEMALGDRSFVEGTLEGLLTRGAERPKRDERPVVFSPFGLGVLDLALAALVVRRAAERGLGATVPAFTL